MTAGPEPLPSFEGERLPDCECATWAIPDMRARPLYPNGHHPRCPKQPAGAVEEFDEWQLTGEPGDDYPPYDFTTHDPAKAEGIRVLYTKIQSGEYPWKNARLRRRHVTVTRTEWEDQ